MMKNDFKNKNIYINSFLIDISRFTNHLLETFKNGTFYYYDKSNKGNCFFTYDSNVYIKYTDRKEKYEFPKDYKKIKEEIIRQFNISTDKMVSKLYSKFDCYHVLIFDYYLKLNVGNRIISRKTNDQKLYYLDQDFVEELFNIYFDDKDNLVLSCNNELIGNKNIYLKDVLNEKNSFYKDLKNILPKRTDIKLEEYISCICKALDKLTIEYKLNKVDDLSYEVTLNDDSIIYISKITNKAYLNFKKFSFELSGFNNKDELFDDLIEFFKDKLYSYVL